MSLKFKMRFTALSLIFLFASTTLAAPFHHPSRQEVTHSCLALCDDVADTGAAIGITARSNFHDWLERRATNRRKNAARQRKSAYEAARNVQLQKASVKAIMKHKTEHGLGKKAPPNAAAIAAGKKAADAKNRELTDAAQAKHKKLREAAKEHSKTKNLPGRNDVFTIAAGNGKPERIHTGKDVRNANFASHLKDDKGIRYGNTFNNNLQTSDGRNERPLPNMVGSGHEHPLSGATTFTQMKKDHVALPSRVISQTIKTGPSSEHIHRGVVSHDQSRTNAHPGKSDHFQIHPSTPPNVYEEAHGDFWNHVVKAHM